MNICLVSTEYPPETGWGGIGTHTYELAHALHEYGHRVVVLSRSPDSRLHEHDDNGVLVCRIPLPSFLQKRLLWRIQHVWNGYNLAVAKKLRQLAARHQIDIVEMPESRAEAFFTVFIKRPCPVVVKLHNGTYLNRVFNNRRFRLQDRIMVWMEKTAVHKADAVVSPTQALIDMNRRKKGYLKKNQLVCILPNLIDTEYYKKNHPPVPHHKPFVLYVGRIEYNKGTDFLFEAMKRVWRNDIDIELIMIGSDLGPGRKLIADLPENMKPRVIIKGHMPRRDIFPYYRHAVACLVLSRWENLPYTCLEAMTSRGAVIGSRNTGMSEIIEDGKSGFLVSPEDSQGIAEKILALYRDAEMSACIRENARQRIQNFFSKPVIVRQTIEHYQQITTTWQQRHGNSGR